MPIKQEPGVSVKQESRETNLDDVPVAPLPDDAIAMEDIVHIEIPSGRKFITHARLLAARSTYFAAVLDNPMKEDSTWQFRLVEHASDWTVSLFVEWLHFSHPSWVGRELEGLLRTTRHWEHPEFQCSLAEAWLLGDSLQATAFRDAVAGVLATSASELKLDQHPLLCPNCCLKYLDVNDDLYYVLLSNLSVVVAREEKKVEFDEVISKLDEATRAQVTHRMFFFCTHISGMD